MAPLAIVEDLDVLEHRAAACAGQRASWMGSTLSVAKKLSATALRQQSPRRLMVPTIPWRPRAVW